MGWRHRRPRTDVARDRITILPLKARRVGIVAKLVEIDDTTIRQLRGAISLIILHLDRDRRTSSGWQRVGQDADDQRPTGRRGLRARPNTAGHNQRTYESSNTHCDRGHLKMKPPP
jgi:hypothetical protein